MYYCTSSMVLSKWSSQRRRRTLLVFLSLPSLLNFWLDWRNNSSPHLNTLQSCNHHHHRHKQRTHSSHGRTLAKFFFKKFRGRCHTVHFLFAKKRVDGDGAMSISNWIRGFYKYLHSFVTNKFKSQNKTAFFWQKKNRTKLNPTLHYFSS